MRETPLSYTRDDDRYVIVASNGGRADDPRWYRDILAGTVFTIEVGGERLQVRPRIADGDERDRLYARQAREVPAYARYEAQTARRIPVIILERVA